MFTETNVTLTSGEGVQMDAFPSNRETAVLSFPFSAESIWVDMQTLTFEASLWDLLDPNSKEQMRFIVLNKDKVLLGEATVPFRENFSLDGNNVSYRTFIKKSGPRRRRAVGSHQIHDAASICSNVWWKGN